MSILERRKTMLIKRCKAKGKKAHTLGIRSPRDQVGRGSRGSTETPKNKKREERYKVMG